MKFGKPVLIALAVLALGGALIYALLDRPSAPASTFTTLDGKQIDMPTQQPEAPANTDPYADPPCDSTKVLLITQADEKRFRS